MEPYGSNTCVRRLPARASTRTPLRRALNRGRVSDPIRTVRGTGYSFDERFGKDEPLSKSA